MLLDDTVSLTEELTNTTAVRASADADADRMTRDSVLTHLCVQQVEVFSGQVDQWRPLLAKQVDTLVVGLRKTDAPENVYRAESHAQLLQSHAHSLHR